MKGMKRTLGRNPASQAIVKQTITVSALALAVAGATGVGFGSAVIGDLPAGNILFLGATSYLQFTTADADVQAAFDGDYSVGTVSTVDVDVADAGEADIIPSTALGAATAKLSPIVRGANATQVMLDNTDGSLELNLNLLIDDANIAGDAAFTVSGVVTIAYIVLGDD
jgi:hypothetical protein